MKDVLDLINNPWTWKSRFDLFLLASLNGSTCTNIMVFKQCYLYNRDLQIPCSSSRTSLYLRALQATNTSAGAVSWVTTHWRAYASTVSSRFLTWINQKFHNSSLEPQFLKHRKFPIVASLSGGSLRPTNPALKKRIACTNRRAIWVKRFRPATARLFKFRKTCLTWLLLKFLEGSHPIRTFRTNPFCENPGG